MVYILCMHTLIQTERYSQWFARLRDARAQARIKARLRRLELGVLGDCKPVGEGVSELRIDYGPGYRLYFVQRGYEVIVLLAGGDKATQAADIRIAIRLSREL
ncbi:RelE family toxin-antitoxin system [Pseudomonas sp. St29]|nr:RelE family toxin-antitoxin system [Pseudomonas sp. St29]